MPWVAIEVMATKKLEQVVRAHWKRENNLHWVLDYVFDEDSQRTIMLLIWKFSGIF